jgi:hypothetical protein
MGVIDREALVARFNVNRIPALTTDIERALNSAGNEDSFVSCQSARNRTRQEDGGFRLPPAHST